MTENYDVVFQMTKACERSINKCNPFSEKEMNFIIKHAVSRFENGQDGRVVKVHGRYRVAYMAENTLYIVRINQTKMAIITIDADEIFDQLLITMWGLVAKHDELNRTLRGIEEALYQQLLSSEKGDEPNEQ